MKSMNYTARRWSPLILHGARNRGLLDHSVGRLFQLDDLANPFCSYGTGRLIPEFYVEVGKFRLDILGILGTEY